MRSTISYRSPGEEHTRIPTSCHCAGPVIIRSTMRWATDDPRGRAGSPGRPSYRNGAEHRVQKSEFKGGIEVTNSEMLCYTIKISIKLLITKD